LLIYNTTTNLSYSVETIETAPQWYVVGASLTGVLFGVPNKLNEVLKVTINQVAGKPSKYFPIVISTDKTTLEDKFSPETLFRLKFRLANERKGLK
jgi:hypothetical protein